MNPNSGIPSDDLRQGNLPMNPGVRPPNPQVAMNNPIGLQQVRPARMEQPNPNVRMANVNYQPRQQHFFNQEQQQNPHQPQRNMYQNYQPVQRPPLAGEAMRFQVNPTGDRPNAPQNVIPGQTQGQRIQMPPQPRFPGSQPQMRFSYNEPNSFPANQPKVANFQQMDPSRVQNTQNSGGPQPDSYKTQVARDPKQVFTRQNSNLGDVQNVSSNHQSEAKPHPVVRPENGQKPTHVTPEKEAALLNGQPPSGENTKSEHDSTTINSIKSDEKKEIDSESNQKPNQPEKKSSKAPESGKEKAKIKDDTITTGTVHKNIKFFEENDTAKTPLTPTALFTEKKEKTMKVFTRIGPGEEEEGSGVDETPMVHPNLRSIYQPPRKVARIPHVRSKGSRRSKTEKKPTSGMSHFNEVSKPSRWPPQYGSRKKQKIKTFSPEEELLAFFENSNLLRKSKRDGSRKIEENATKDKVVLKPTTNGDIGSPKKTPSKLPGPSRKNPSLSSPTKTPLKSPGTPGGKSLPKTPETPTPPAPLIKKVPMNKIQVGAAPSPNLKAVKSKVGSLANTTHKPGGGNVRVETHKIDFSRTQPRIEAKNLQYAPSGGEKKITQVKLQWSAQSKVGSLENSTYKPGGGDKKIESVKLDFKEKAKPKVGSKDNVKHVPGGGNIKIENQKLEFKAQSKVGSLDNVKHKPGGGDIKIFDDKTYLKQISTTSSEGRVSGTQSYGDLSVVREVEGRSAPGTPGRKTAVKIKKITTIQSGGESPTLKNITEVTVMSQTPKKDKNVRISPTKDHIKLTYSKFSSSKSGEAQDYVGLIKIPANVNAPILKSNLSRKDVLNVAEVEKNSGAKVVNGTEKKTDTELNIDKKSLENSAQSSGSPNLPEGKLNLKVDSGISKFLQDEMATHEKVGEIWKEMNTIDNKSNLTDSRQNKEPTQDHFYGNYRSDVNSQQFRPGNGQQLPNFNSKLNEQPQNYYRPPLLHQEEQGNQMSQQRFSSTAQQQGYQTSSQQHQPYNSNLQFHKN